MRNVPAALQTHLNGDVTTLATCWRVECRDGTEFFFTDHDTDLVVSGDTYLAATGIIPTSLRQTGSLAVDTQEIVSVLDSDQITVGDLAAGKFDLATLDVFIVNWAAPADGVIYLAKGWTIGEISRGDITFRAECRSKCQRYSQSIVQSYSPGCRADLGDSRCGVDLADSAQTFWRSGTVTSVTDRQTFRDTSRAEEQDYFRFGKLTWTGPSDNPNLGREVEVKSFNSATDEFVLFLPMADDISTGDEYEVTYGCDKSFATCRDTFDNAVNFRGEPYVPGFDGMLKVGGQESKNND